MEGRQGSGGLWKVFCITLAWKKKDCWVDGRYLAVFRMALHINQGFSMMRRGKLSAARRLEGLSTDSGHLVVTGDNVQRVM